MSQPIDPAPERPVAAMLVIILNFNGMEDTLACLASLRDQTYRDFAILVVDNASVADDLDRIRAGFPEVELQVLPENLGWAGGNNVGMRLALERGHRYACLLNNDTLLDTNVFEKLVAASAALDDRALIQPTVAFHSAPDTWQLRPEAAPGVPMAVDIFEIAGALGVCLLVSDRVMREIGLLDERFFLQLEETDYFWRAKARGIGSHCVMGARVLHKESVSFGGRISPTKTYYEVRNSFLLAEKHDRSARGFAATARRVLWSLENKARLSDATMRGWPHFLRWVVSSNPMAAAARQGMRDYLRRRFGRRPDVAALRRPG